MCREIEHKFAVRSDAFKPLAVARLHIRQAYLCFGPPVTLRLRQKDDTYIMTVKGPSSRGGTTRTEVEKPLSRAEFEALWPLHRGHIIEKYRYLVPWKGRMIEVDEFVRPRPGLVIAEIELREGESLPELPSWIGEELTGRPEYQNSYMARHG
ncbi:MAG: CYTH domain-containing protein [Chlorobi bacterium]|nr:CYTH domain-containing protein [Chlorobiota bacterium]